MRISSFLSRRERRCRWKKPVSSIARAIIRDIRARRKALNTKSRMPRLVFAAWARLAALRRQTRRKADRETRRQGERESAACTINLTFLSLERLCRNVSFAFRRRKSSLAPLFQRGVMLMGERIEVRVFFYGTFCAENSSQRQGF
jgi:hypothetical protein